MTNFNVSQSTGVNLASSVAGTQKNANTKDQTEAAAGKDFKQSLKTIASKEVGDASESETSPDRDADGRLLAGEEPSEGQEEKQHQADSTANAQVEKPHARSVDPDGEIGTHLDLDG